MNKEQIELLVERWMADEDFRVRMRQAPVATAADEGFELTEEEQQALAQLDFSQSDAELARHANFA